MRLHLHKDPGAKQPSQEVPQTSTKGRQERWLLRRTLAEGLDGPSSKYAKNPPLFSLIAVEPFLHGTFFDFFQEDLSDS